MTEELIIMLMIAGAVFIICLGISVVFLTTNVVINKQRDEIRRLKRLNTLLEYSFRLKEYECDSLKKELKNISNNRYDDWFHLSRFQRDIVKTVEGDDEE